LIGLDILDECILSKNMTDQDLLQRISSDLSVVAGKPVVKGTRLSVDFILNLLAYGASFDEIIEE